jgi:nitrate reductase gamma subunit
MGTIGGKLGCAASFLIAFVLSFPLLFAISLVGAHCEPIPQCRRATEQHFGLVIAGVLAFAGIMGLLIRRVVNHLAGKRSDDGTSSGFVIATTLAVLLFSGLLMLVASAVIEQIS